jgi:hypothetical protein
MATNSYTSTIDLTGVYRYIRSVQLVETSGTAAIRIQVKDTDVNGVVLIVLSALTSSSATFVPARPIRFPGGARLEIVSGTGRISIDGY